MCGQLRWEGIKDVREFLFDKCMLPPRTIGEIWKEQGGKDRLQFEHTVVLCHLQDKKRPVKMEFGQAVDWAFRHASMKGYADTHLGMDMWIHQILEDTANASFETKPVSLDSKYVSEEDVPYQQLVIVPAYRQYFPNPTRFSDVALSFFRGEMSDQDRLTFDFDREMLWPSFPVDIVDAMFEHNAANQLRYDGVPSRDIGEESGSDNGEWFSMEQHDAFLNRVWDQPYHYEEEWTKHKGGMEKIKITEVEADQFDHDRLKDIVVNGQKLYAKASGACSRVKRLDVVTSKEWLAEMEAKRLAIARLSPFYKE